MEEHSSMKVATLVEKKAFGTLAFICHGINTSVVTSRYSVQDFRNHNLEYRVQSGYPAIGWMLSNWKGRKKKHGSG